jgi:hypothetical protein
MSDTPSKYNVTLRDLRQYCRLLAKIEVTGHGSSVAGCTFVKGTEELVGRNAAGEIVVRVKGPITPKKTIEFRRLYQLAVAAGILKEAHGQS